MEKLLKAYLMSVGVLFQKTHDLDALRKQAAQVDSTFEFYDDMARRLNAYAIDVRYPGDEPDRKEANRAMKAMKEIRAFVWGKLKGRI